MRMIRGILLLGVLLIGAGCASQPPPPSESAEVPGFFLGFLHGFISPFAAFVSFFDGSVRMYAYPNEGVAYDVGFLLGFLALTGSGSTAARRRRRRPLDTETEKAPAVIAER